MSMLFSARPSCSLSSMFRSLASAATASGAALSASPSKPLVSLTEPLTRRTCNAIRDALHSAYPQSEDTHDPSETHAAVLVPLCNVDGRPGVLLEVRGKLRTHSGEVRYVFRVFAAPPQVARHSLWRTASRAAKSTRYERRIDLSSAFHCSHRNTLTYTCTQADPTTLAAALRETQEEVGISPDQVELLGRFGPPELSLGGMRVWPYVVRTQYSRKD